MLITKAKD